jgi:hypothetical protein
MHPAIRLRTARQAKLSPLPRQNLSKKTNTGAVEPWKDGILERWKNGMME